MNDDTEDDAVESYFNSLISSDTVLFPPHGNLYVYFDLLLKTVKRSSLGIVTKCISSYIAKLKIDLADILFCCNRDLDKLLVLILITSQYFSTVSAFDLAYLLVQGRSSYEQRIQYILLMFSTINSFKFYSSIEPILLFCNFEEAAIRNLKRFLKILENK